MTHPLQRWPRSHRRPALIALTVAALLPTVLGAAVHPLHEDDPGGKSIVDFELAGWCRYTRRSWPPGGLQGYR